MKLLAIDTSCTALGAALAEDDGARRRVIGSVNINTGKNHSIALLPMTKALLENCGLTLNALDALAVTVGPGSFTGLRIGIATIKAWGDALGLPLIAVSGTAAMARAAGLEGYICPVFDARRDEVYAALFRDNARLEPDMAIAPRKLAERLRELSAPVLLAGDALPRYRELFAEALGDCFRPLAEERAMFMAEAAALIALDKAAARDFVAGQDLLPLYLRLSEAEEKRLNARNQGAQVKQGEQAGTKTRPQGEKPCPDLRRGKQEQKECRAARTPSPDALSGGEPARPDALPDALSGGEPARPDALPDALPGGEPTRQDALPDALSGGEQARPDALPDALPGGEPTRQDALPDALSGGEPARPDALPDALPVGEPARQDALPDALSVGEPARPDASTSEEGFLDIEFAPLETKHLDELMEIELASFTHPWTRDSYLHDLTKNPLAHYLGCFAAGRLVGFAGFWQVLDEGHVTNIAVKPEFRRQHLGELMMRQLITACLSFGGRRMTLEVREQNGAAHRLYEKLGFTVRGKRAGYYDQPPDDALIMWLEMGSSPEQK